MSLGGYLSKGSVDALACGVGEGAGMLLWEGMYGRLDAGRPLPPK